MSEETLRAIQEVTHGIDLSSIVGLVVLHRGYVMGLSWPRADEACPGSERWCATCEVARGEGDGPLAALNACANEADELDDDGGSGDPRLPMHELMHSASEMGGYEQDDEHPPVERLDLSKPPPGYEVGPDGYWLLGLTVRSDVLATEREALDAAWEHYQARHNPPGMWVDSIAWGVLGLDYDETATAADSETEARAAAWRWYLRRLVLAERIDCGFTAHGGDVGLWPRALTWSDAECEQVETWLVDSTAELPEVLRG